MIVPINLERLSGNGYKMNANSPTASTPSYITHAQLRYSPFTSSEAIQGAFVTGANSTVEFDVTGNNLYVPLKLYTSLNGTTYTEDKTYGGTNGVPCLPPSVLDPADFNGGVPRSNGTSFSNMGIDVGTATNDMLMWNGTKWLKKTLAEAYAIISVSSFKTYKGFITQDGTEKPTFGQIYINSFTETVAATRTSIGLYTFSGISTTQAKLHGNGQLYPVYDNTLADPITGVFGYYRFGVDGQGRVTMSTYDTDMILADGIIAYSQLINIICNN